MGATLVWLQATAVEPQLLRLLWHLLLISKRLTTKNIGREEKKKKKEQWKERKIRKSKQEWNQNN